MVANPDDKRFTTMRQQLSSQRAAFLKNPMPSADRRKRHLFQLASALKTNQQLCEAIDHINTRPRPLALYYFDHNRRRIHTVLNQTRSGGVCINDTLAHVAQDDLPFGGIGQSGMGAYHGKTGFQTFSKARPVFQRGRVNSTRLAWPPYGSRIQRWLHRFLLR